MDCEVKDRRILLEEMKIIQKILQKYLHYLF